jgi:hypothetical protein
MVCALDDGTCASVIDLNDVTDTAVYAAVNDDDATASGTVNLA